MTTKLDQPAQHTDVIAAVSWADMGKWILVAAAACAIVVGLYRVLRRRG